MSSSAGTSRRLFELCNLCHLRTVAHWTLRKEQNEFWNEKQTFVLTVLELLKSTLWSMTNRYLILKFYCHKSLFLIALSILQKMKEFKRWKMSSCSSNEFLKLCSLRWNQSERFILGKLFLQFDYYHKNLFFFFCKFFCPFLVSWYPFQRVRFQQEQ